MAAAAGAAKGAVDFVRVVQNVRRAVSIGNLGMIVGEQVLMVSALFVHQYLTATRRPSPKNTRPSWPRWPKEALESGSWPTPWAAAR
jgi:hypothetical protein